MTDRKLPRGDRKFVTAKRWLTHYALACGYIEVRGDDESGMRLELLSSGVFFVRGCGRWIRTEADSYHETLRAARRAFAGLDHRALSSQIATKNG